MANIGKEEREWDVMPPADIPAPEADPVPVPVTPELEPVPA